MIIEPVPTSPRGSLGRLRRLLGVVMAPVLLVGVVGLGLAGRDGEPAGRAATPPPGAIPGTAAPTGAIDALAPDGPASRPTAAFPTRILGSDVLTPTEALTARRADTGAALFVSGWLTMGPLHPSCAEPMYRPRGALCHRTSVLAEHPAGPGEDGGWSTLGPHLHPEFPPGVRLPPGVGRFSPEPMGEPVPVVVLGRYGDPRAAPCDPSRSRCRPAFVVERVVWTNGERFGWTTTIDAGLELDLAEEPWRRYRDAARAHLRDVTLISMSALLAPASLTHVDREAAQALEAHLATLAEVDRPPHVWYVRGVDLRERRGGGLRGTARWVVTAGDGAELLVSSEGAQAR